MRLDVPFKRVADIDVARLERTVEKLAPLYERDVWPIVRERMQWIGKDERPTDVAYRKMTPTSYAQLCVVNDESPMSPWALSIPFDLMTEADQASFAEEWRATCARLYGPGVLCFAGFAILGPGGIIPEHKDMAHAQHKKAFSHHLHAPVLAPDECEFTWNGVKTKFEAGGLYEVDNMAPHSAIHTGTHVRVNLMLDYCPEANLAKRNI